MNGSRKVVCSRLYELLFSATSDCIREILTSAMCGGEASNSPNEVAAGGRDAKFLKLSQSTVAR